MDNHLYHSAQSTWRHLEQIAMKGPLRYDGIFRIPLKKGSSCHMHDHPALEIVLHVVGEGNSRLEEGPVCWFPEGSAVLYAPRQLHDQTMTASGEDICLQLELPRRLSRQLRGCLLVPEVESWILEEAQSLFRGMEARDLTAQRIFDFRVTAVLLALLRQAFAERRPLTAAQRTTQQAQRFLRRQFAELGSIDDVAAHVGLSPDRLRHVFKAQTGTSLVTYLNEVRIDHARTLLTQTGLPLKRIATLCGFRDEYYFSTVFRRLSGLPPGRFRESRRRGSGPDFFAL